MPLGNDLLIIALTAAHRARMPYYIIMATIGSVIGVAFTTWVSAKGGQKGLEGDHKGRQVAYVERKLKEKGGLAIALAAVMPPPFPFTAVIIVAGALQFPVKKMLAIIAGSRAFRFTVDAVLALIFGREVIRIAQTAWVKDFIIGLVVVSILGSAYSIFTWVRKSRKGHATQAHAISRT